MNPIENSQKRSIYIFKIVARFSVISGLGTHSTKCSLDGTRGFNKKVELASGRQFQYITKCCSFKICFHSWLEFEKRLSRHLGKEPYWNAPFWMEKICFLNFFFFFNENEIWMLLKTVVNQRHLCKTSALTKLYNSVKIKTEYMSSSFVVTSKTK